MGFFDILKMIFGCCPSGPKLRKLNLTPPDPGLGPEELARRLELPLDQMLSVGADYFHFDIPKRRGGKRGITAPNPALKQIQRRILRRLLNRLNTHSAAMGFEKHESIVTNALCHVGSEVVLRMDFIAFFNSTTVDRLRAYFYGIGWGKEATDILIRLCTHNGSLPQGAPTSPRLSNLINIEMDARLDGWAKKVGAIYTRYADDMTFSFAQLAYPLAITQRAQNPRTLEHISKRMEARHIISSTIRMTKWVLAEYGYELHSKRKLNIRRRHQQQRVCGLVVNERVALPRKTRRWLRAVRHHIDNGRGATLTPKQLAGWDALEQMIATQTAGSE